MVLNIIIALFISYSIMNAILLFLFIAITFDKKVPRRPIHPINVLLDRRYSDDDKLTVLIFLIAFTIIYYINIYKYDRQ